jgi:hypothetical protein
VFIVYANSPNAIVGEVAQIEMIYLLSSVFLLEDEFVLKQGKETHNQLIMM